DVRADLRRVGTPQQVALARQLLDDLQLMAVFAVEVGDSDQFLVGLEALQNRAHATVGDDELRLVVERGEVVGEAKPRSVPRLVGPESDWEGEGVPRPAQPIDLLDELFEFPRADDNEYPHGSVSLCVDMGAGGTTASGVGQRANIGDWGWWPRGGGSHPLGL